MNAIHYHDKAINNQFHCLYSYDNQPIWWRVIQPVKKILNKFKHKQWFTIWSWQDLFILLPLISYIDTTPYHYYTMIHMFTLKLFKDTIKNLVNTDIHLYSYWWKLAPFLVLYIHLIACSGNLIPSQQLASITSHLQRLFLIALTPMWSVGWQLDKNVGGYI